MARVDSLRLVLSEADPSVERASARALLERADAVQQRVTAETLGLLDALAGEAMIVETAAVEAAMTSERARKRERA